MRSLLEVGSNWDLAIMPIVLPVARHIITRDGDLREMAILPASVADICYPDIFAFVCGSFFIFLTNFFTRIIVVLNRTTYLRGLIKIDLQEVLTKVGLTRQESLLYLALCKEGEISGYEAAKISGIPRSNAYLALAGLVEKGGAYRSESQTTRYLAVPPAEWTANLRREFNQILDYLEQNLPQPKTAEESFVTIRGEKQVTDKIKNIINQARARIYLSADHPELMKINAELNQAADRGLKVVVITDEPWTVSGCKVYHRQPQSGQLRLIADSEEVLTGEWSLDGAAQCIYSKNKNLVQLIKDSLTNEIKLIELQEQ